MNPPSSKSIVIMGVSGTGKSTIGRLLAASLGVPFIDADDLHSLIHKQKMAAGIPLNDADRLPWLARVGESMAEHKACVCACSALKRDYRDAIRSARPDAIFIELNGSRNLIIDRLTARQSHFMSNSLIDSQYSALESLDADEAGFQVRIDDDVDIVLAAITGRLNNGNALPEGSTNIGEP
jgi:gluconokinase